MILFPILKFASTSYRMSHLCWPKSVPPTQSCHLPPPPLPPRGQRSIMMRFAIMCLRLPITSYHAYMKIPRSVRPPRLLLLVFILLLMALIFLLCILLVVLVLLTVVTTGILLVLLILLPPGTLTTIVLSIRISVTQFLVQATKSYLPSPIQTLFSTLSCLQQSLFNRDEKRDEPFVVQTTPNIALIPSVIVAPTCLPDLPPRPPTSTPPRTLRRSKSWLRW